MKMRFGLKLAEIGRKISKANAEKLRKAWREVSDILALCAEETDATEAERSQGERASLLLKAVRDRVKTDSGSDYGPWVYICDIFDSALVYCVDGSDCYQCDYSVADDGTVTLGDAVEVIPHMTYDPVPVDSVSERLSLQGDVVPLVEAGVLQLTEAQLSEAKAEIKLISPGWGSSGYYSPSVLKRDGPAAFPKGTHMYLDHMSVKERTDHPENSVTRLAAVLEGDAQWIDNHPRGPALYAPARIGKNGEQLVRDFTADIGVSISAGGVGVVGEAEDRKGTIITALDSRADNPFNSVDFVTLPGRGGEIVQLFESAGRKPVVERKKEETEMTDEQVKALVESAVTTAVTAAVKPFQEAAATHATETARLREALGVRDAREFAVKRLGTITLPQATRDRLAESLALNPPIKDGALDIAAFTTAIDEAAKHEAEYLQRATGGSFGLVAGMGSVREAAAPKPEELKATLASKFRSLGMSEAAANVAAEGRAA